MRSAMNQAPSSPPPSSLMAGLSQSFIPPSHMSLHRRPGMPARSVSNMSELSVTSTSSQQSNEFGDSTSSRPTTPSYPSTSAGEKAPSAKYKSASALETSSAIKSSRPSFSRPIAIEVPKMTRLSSAPVYTPPEPLSARGDLPGGYFPLHEDPKTRVRRTHPFHPKAATTRAGTEAANVRSDLSQQSQPTVFGSWANQGSHISAAPYLPHSLHDNPMSLGKYYPSNYENRKSLQASGRTATPSSSSWSQTAHMQASGSGHASSSLASSSSNDDTMRRKMQKYQHDIMAQTAMALGNTAAANAPRPAAGIILNDMTMNLVHATSEKSLPPRLELSRSAKSFDDERRGKTRQLSSAGVDGDVNDLSMPLNQSTSSQTSSQQKQNIVSTGTQTVSNESHRKMLQQQHQAITQAMAEAPQASTGVLLNELSVYLNQAISISPTSPRLLPLGSPGPVTPMDLESGGAGRADSRQSISERLGRSYR